MRTVLKAHDIGEPLDGKIALVTGGSKGIGLATACELYQRGCNVAIVSRNQDNFRVLSKGKNFFWASCDVLKQSSIQESYRKIISKFNRIDILVNNVGGGGRWGKSILDTEHTVWRQVYEKNAEAAIRFTLLCLPFMLKNNWGRVVTISSIYGKESGGKPWFNMAKSAEISLMKSLSQEKNLVRHNITFNTVCPGHISVKGKPDETNIDDFPLGRMGRPEEVASVVSFLCGMEASLVNGACITVDGGESKSF